MGKEAQLGHLPGYALGGWGQTMQGPDTGRPPPPSDDAEGPGPASARASTMVSQSWGEGTSPRAMSWRGGRRPSRRRALPHHRRETDDGTAAMGPEGDGGVGPF